MRSSRLLIPAVPALLGTLLVSAANPNCAGPSSGPRQFGEDSIVIPMDECWQPYKNVNTPDGGDIEPPGGAGLGGVCSTKYTMGTLYAYGLVYDLIVNGVTVYWAIDPSKATVTSPDVLVPGTSSQATLYDFTASSAHGAANGTALGVEAAGSGTDQCSSSGICYRGGPFLIDGADFTTVYNLLQTTAFAPFKNNIQLHVMHPTSPFTAPINRSLVGTPPTLAILAAPGVDCFETSPILDQYLIDAHLPTSVYASLYAPDLNYTTGNLVGSNLSKYSLLWIPHFDLDDGQGDYASPATAPITCNSDGVPSTQMTATQAGNLASVIGQFVAGGGNLFAECAGISALEGDDGYAQQDNLSSSSRFETTTGIDGDFSPADGGKLTYFHPESPFMQFGDFPFDAKSGYVGAWLPQAKYNTGVTSLVQTNLVYPTIGDDPSHPKSQTSDVLTWLPAASASANSGTVVYLGGHSYTNYTDPDNNTLWQQNVAGERMVLNTLLTLSGSCTVPTADGGYCDTGLLGVCAAGSYACVNSTLTCQETTQPSVEICDGLDNDCDGLVDDDVPPQSCYSGPTGTQTCQGATTTSASYPCGCHAGSQFCIAGAYGACTGEADPSTEICNGVDDDCDGFIDNIPGGDNPLSQTCYSGPPGTEGIGLCVGGNQVCEDGGFWSGCQGEVTPVYGLCDGMDNDCNGTPDSCSICTAGQTQPCYTGPAGTLGVGLCKAGTQSCIDGGWGASCSGQVLPVYDGGFCDGLDHDCDNQPDLCSACTPGDSRPCYTGPAGTEGIGICKGGTQTCSVGGAWGSCLGEVLPVPASCDGLDNTCDGVIDDGATCAGSDICVNGVCVPGICGGEIGGSCPLGYSCVSGACAVSTCGTGPICPEGDSCLSDGGCLSPCAGVSCGPGSICAGGQCVAGGCTSIGCGPDGGVCVQGSCIANPCDGVTCPDGTFCSSGYCVQACAFLTCPSGEICDQTGQCVAPPCGGRCAVGQACINGSCATDPCASVRCAQGQVCSGGICVDDPCAIVECPGQLACVDGQCVDGLRDGGGFGSGTTATTSTGTGTTGAASGTTGTMTSGSGTTGAHATTGNGATTTGGTSTPTAKSGCGCTTGTDPLGAWPLVALLGILRFRRRRPRAIPPWRRWAWAALLLGACSTAAPAGSTGSGSHSATTGIGLSNTASTTTGSGSTTTSGGSGCQPCGSACVVLASDPHNCGACGHACATGEECLFGACGPSGPVAPILDSLSPSAGNFGTTLTVTLVGGGFTQQTQVLLTGSGLSANDLQTTTYVDSQHVSFDLSLLTITAATIDIAALNPDKLLSNALPFTIGSPGSPVLSSVTPTSAPTGAPVALVFAGSGLQTNTEIHVVGGALADQAIPTSQQTGTAANATWDLTTVAPGNYSFYALTPGAPESNTLSFTVSSIGPSLTSITPNSAATNTQPQVSIAGSGFDGSSILLFGAAGSVTTTEATGELSPTLLSGTLDLTNVAPGDYEVEVQNTGGLVGGPLSFTVTSVTAQISTVTPNTAVAGTQVNLAISGSGFDQTSVAHFQGAGGLDTALSTTYQDGSDLGATLDLSAVAPGAYAIVIENAGVSASSSLAFTVTQDTPTLSGIVPSSALQDSGSQTLTLSGFDLQDGSTVTFQSVGGGVTTFTLTLSVTGGSGSGTVTLDPSSQPVGSYLVTVMAAGGTVSNPGTFAIQPGTPVVDQISPSSSPQAPASVTLCGQYFVAGLSSVHVTGLNTVEILPGTFGGSTGCPSGSDSSIAVSADLTQASPGVYQVTIWNGATLISNPESFTVNGP